jgi:HAD superfamily hydrolase (TIGR01509 family)
MGREGGCAFRAHGLLFRAGMNSPPSPFAHARALLMDVDGTLLDSADAQARCWLTVLQDFGYHVDYRQVRARIGLGPDRILHELCGISEASARAQRLLPIRELLLRSHELPSAQTFPGVHQFIARVQGSGARLAVVTSAYRSEALALLGAAQLLTDFDHVVCRQDVRETKPAGDALWLALDRLGVRPEEAVMIASSPYDLAAAHAARVPCVALRSGGWPDSALVGGSHAYDDLRDLLDHWQDDPLESGDRQLPATHSFMWREPFRTRGRGRPSNSGMH